MCSSSGAGAVSGRGSTGGVEFSFVQRLGAAIGLRRWLRWVVLHPFTGSKLRSKSSAHYSQRNAFAEIAVQTTKHHGQRRHVAAVRRSIPRRARCLAAATRRRSSGSARAIACSTGGSDVDRHEQAGQPEHRIEDQRADRLREARRRDDAGDEKAERQDAQRAEEQRQRERHERDARRPPGSSAGRPAPSPRA